jgi:MFS family permease
MWLKQQKASAVKTGLNSFMDFLGKFLKLFSPLYRKLFMQALVLTTLDMSAYWLTYSWMPGYLYQQRGFTMTKSALWILVTQAGGFLGYLSFGFMADKLGRRPAYSIFSVIMALGLTMITVFWDAVVQIPAVILFFMFTVGFGTGMFSGYGPLFAELFPTDIRNTAMGSAFNLARGVQFFTPVAIAVIAGKYGLGGGIFLASFFAILTGLWIWTFPETKGKKLEV